MQENGISEKEILNLLEKKLEKDYDYNSGSILGSMCTEPLELGKQIYLKYISKNLGDPGLFSGTMQLEEEIISELGELYGAKDIVGTFTTGGSEANLIAMRIAKKLRPDIKNPEVIVPLSSPVSFDKAADLMNINLRKVKLKPDFQLDLDHFSSLINNNTCGVVGVAGTTSLGLIDPIEKIAKLIENRNIFFHVDAAFGGFVLPFLKLLGKTIPPWDFSVKEVDSITADPHKMGLNVIPSGGLFLRDKAILEKTGFEIPYLAGGNFKHFHIVGTRPGGPVIAFWAILRFLGINGFKKIISKCMDNTQYLAKRIYEIKGLRLSTEPIMNVVGITTEKGIDICDFDSELRKKGWMLGKFKDFNLIRAVLMPHITKQHLIKFTEDLEVIAKKLKLHS
ncbi:MAG: tyrosine decarboxylase MfnA [Candidatus Hermodarchaeota archaeon]